MRRRARVPGFLLAALAANAVSCFAATTYPGAVEIHRFETAKAIYRPGETVEFRVGFTASRGHESPEAPGISVQVWIERETDAPFLAVSKESRGASGARREAALEWVCDKDVFGHRAWVRFVDAEGRLLAEKDTLFDVAGDWIHVMRLASLGANHAATADHDDAKVRAMVGRLREAHYNAFEVFTFSPAPYELAPAADSWPYQYAKPGAKPILKERIQSLGRELHRHGIKFIAYNETSAARGPADWQVFLKNVSMEKPFAHYFADRGMFTPNALKIAPLFAAQLAGSVKMFGWDGILMDSAISCHIVTSDGYDAKGDRLTDLSAGEVGRRYLAPARAEALKTNPEFRFLSQNATSVSHKGVREPVDAIRPWVRANGERLKIREYSKEVDLYTLEIDAHNEPRDGRYPLTYERMSVSLNSLIETLGRPLLAWAFVVPPFPAEYSVAFVRPYLSLLLASRVHVHDHFDFYGGAVSDQRGSPAAEQFIRYHRFLARYSRYLYDPALSWVPDPEGRVAVESARPLFWKRTVYSRPLPDGGERVVANVLNLPSNGLILDQTEIPPPAQNVVVRVRGDANMRRAVYLDADDPSLRPLALEAVPGGGREYRLPPVAAWGVVVIETGK